MRLNLILNLRKNLTVQEIARGVLLRITPCVESVKSFGDNLGIGFQGQS